MNNKEECLVCSWQGLSVHTDSGHCPECGGQCAPSDEVEKELEFERIREDSENKPDLLEIFRDMDRVCGVAVFLSHSQVLEITVKELLSKYRIHKDSDCGKSFHRVLQFYLSNDELVQALRLDDDIKRTSVLRVR